MKNARRFLQKQADNDRRRDRINVKEIHLKGKRIVAAEEKPVAEPTPEHVPHARGLVVQERDSTSRIGGVCPDGAFRGGWRDRDWIEEEDWFHSPADIEWRRVLIKGETGRRRCRSG